MKQTPMQLMQIPAVVAAALLPAAAGQESRGIEHPSVASGGTSSSAGGTGDILDSLDRRPGA